MNDFGEGLSILLAYMLGTGCLLGGIGLGEYLWRRLRVWLRRMHNQRGMAGRLNMNRMLRQIKTRG